MLKQMTKCVSMLKLATVNMKQKKGLQEVVQIFLGTDKSYAEYRSLTWDL